MKILFTAAGDTWESQMDPRFGRSPILFVFDEDLGETTIVDNSDVADEAHGAGPKTAQKMIEQDAKILITGNGPGGNAATVLKAAEIKVYTGAGDMTIQQAYDAFRSDALTEF